MRNGTGAISSLVAAFDQIGLKLGDHLLTVLQNRWEAATLHWACQFAGLVMTPINWRAKAGDVDFCAQDSQAKAVVYEGVSADAVAGSREAQKRTRIALDAPRGSDIAFQALVRGTAPDPAPRVGAEAWSVMLYTSGTTAKPKGVPRQHRAERAAALAHVAQNLYAHGEITLGVMPLYGAVGHSRAEGAADGRAYQRRKRARQVFCHGYADVGAQRALCHHDL